VSNSPPRYQSADIPQPGRSPAWASIRRYCSSLNCHQSLRKLLLRAKPYGDGLFSGFPHSPEFIACRKRTDQQWSFHIWQPDNAEQRWRRDRGAGSSWGRQPASDTVRRTRYRTSRSSTCSSLRPRRRIIQKLQSLSVR